MRFNPSILQMPEVWERKVMRLPKEDVAVSGALLSVNITEAGKEKVS
jgi:hypothetical protein